MQKSVLILAVASLIGLAADGLFRNTVSTGIPIGLGIPLFVQLMACATIFIAFKSNMPLGRKGLYFLLPALMYSIGFVVRDSPTLLAIDLGVVFLSMSFAALSLTGVSLTTSGISTYLSSILSGAILPFINAADLLYSYVEWDKLMPQAASRHMRSVMRGLMIGVPITAVFFGLFVSADPAFAAIVGKSIKFDIGEAFVDSFIVGLFTWMATGYFHTFSLSKMSQDKGQLLAPVTAPVPILATVGASGTVDLRPQMPETLSSTRALMVSEPESPPGVKLGITEIAVALGLLNLLFAAFVAVQLKFLFGGASLIGLTPGLTFAEYARKGFFDLNIAAALVLPILLWADHMLVRSSKTSVAIQRGLSFSLLGLLAVVMASALMRMHLYQTEYGQSELRFYTTAFMTWLGMVCTIFAGTVLVGKRKFFAFTSFAAGLSVITGLHVINPDAMIAKANISHAKTGKSFDAAYAVSLSNDAVPALVKNIDDLPRGDQRIIAKTLVGQHSGAWKTDWRSFNLSRMFAYQVVNDNKEKLALLAKD